MFKSGEFVSEYVTQLDGSTVPDKQVQPHGVELTVDEVYRLSDFCVLADDDYTKATRKEPRLVESGVYNVKSRGDQHASFGIEELEDEDDDEKDVTFGNGVVRLDCPHYALIRGAYVVKYNEKIEIPEEHVGFVWPRSRLIRNNNYLSSAVWDSGYEGRGEGGLHINTMTFIQKGMRIGQMLMCRASVMEQYDGSHQGENLDQE